MAGKLLGEVTVDNTLKTKNDDDDLSNAQIHQLLVDAEQRLKSASAALEGSSSLMQDNRLLLQSDHDVFSYIQSNPQKAHIDQTLFVTRRERKLANGMRHIEDPVIVKYKTAKAKAGNIGADWFNLPRTDMTTELKRDLQMLRMRSVLDPKRHYKKEDIRRTIPAFSQVGTVAEGPTEYYGGRLNRKERKQTFVEEILAWESVNGRFKLKYNEIQRMKISGKRAFYKAVKAQRSPRRSKS